MSTSASSFRTGGSSMIVVVDNYDSFTYNIVDYLGKISDLKIVVSRNDEISIAQLSLLNPEYIIISPGPKRPKDAGISKDIISSFKGRIPILGVCLGHQAIAEVFGNEIVKATEPKHGKVSLISHNNDLLFQGVANNFKATRYHSLVINQDNLSDNIEVLAYSEDDNEIMAIKHKVFPIYGLQFHPESIYTLEGLRLIDNFLRITKKRLLH